MKFFVIIIHNNNSIYCVSQSWFPQDAVSWYSTSTTMANLSFTDHDKFGMETDASVWKQYLLSFYWVAATLTCNG